MYTVQLLTKMTPLTSSNLSILSIMIILQLLLGPRSSSYVRCPPIIYYFITASARLSKYAADTAQRKLIVHTPTDVNNGGPRLCVLS